MPLARTSTVLRMLLIVAAALAPTLAGAADAARSIAVTGVGRWSSEPDIATINLGVETRGRTAAEARAAAALAMSRLLEALAAQQIDDQDIQTSWVGLTPVYGGDGQRVIEGYALQNEINVTVRDLARTGMVVDAAVSAGGDALRVQGVGFALDDARDAEARARVLAVEDARLKAESYASLTGLRLGKVLQLRESGALLPRPFGAEAMLARAEVGTPVRAGQIELNVSVEVIYAIE